MRGLISCASLVFLAACASVLAPAKPRWPPFPDSNFMHVGAFLQVSGTGRAQGKTTSDSQRMSLSRDEALLDAWQRLRSYLGLLTLVDGSSAKERAAASKEFKSGLDSLVYSAEIASTKFDAGTAAVVLRLPKERVNAALGTEYP